MCPSVHVKEQLLHAAMHARTCPGHANGISCVLSLMSSTEGSLSADLAANVFAEIHNYSSKRRQILRKGSQLLSKMQLGGMLFSFFVQRKIQTKAVPEFIDTVFAKTSPKRPFSIMFWRNWVYKFGHWTN
jgi:hypothetical protein